jgi:hypothetical protein
MKTCQAPGCDNPIDQDRRSDSTYCSSACKRRAMRARKKARKSSNSLDTGSGTYAESHAADARFHATVAAGEAMRVTKRQAAEWAAHARRHGTIHPGEQAARIARGQQARADDWQQGTASFVRPSNSLAEKARDARARQRRPVITGRSQAGHRDDELLEPPEMTEGDIFRSGYRHASSYR